MTREGFLLMKLAEECAEVSQRALKQIQFGAAQVQKAGEVAGGTGPGAKEEGLSNGERLKKEILDLAVMIKLLEESNEVPEIEWDEFLAAREAKIAKLNKYLAFARSLGQLPGEWTV